MLGGLPSSTEIIAKSGKKQLPWTYTLITEAYRGKDNMKVWQLYPKLPRWSLCLVATEMCISSYKALSQVQGDGRCNFQNPMLLGAVDIQF